MDKTSLWSISPNVRTTYRKNGAMVLDVRKGFCYRLNPVAAHIWGRIESSQSGIDLQGLIDLIKTHYSVSREQLESDTGEYLTMLQRMGLVQHTDLVEGAQVAGPRG